MLSGSDILVYSSKAEDLITKNILYILEMEKLKTIGTMWVQNNCHYKWYFMGKLLII